MDLSSYIDVGRAVSEGYKVWILVAGLGLVAVWTLLPPRLSRALLITLTLVATLNYGRWGPKVLLEQVDTYDLVHYYLNAKYFEELGYYDLYPACILADHENQGPYFEEGDRYMAQNEAGHGMRAISHAVDRGQQVREEKFSPERWEDFEHDFLVLQRQIPGFNSKLWRQMIQDHGFNGTLPWVLAARPLTEIVPVEWVKLLGFVDLGMLLVGVGAVFWAYGSTPALFAWFFLMVSYSVRWPTISWALLRYDWVMMLLVGMAMVRKGRPFLGGLATGYAGAMRLFPIMWLYGPGMKGIFALFRGRLRMGLVSLAAGALLAVAALNGAAIAVWGPEPVQVHFENMEDHNSALQLSSRRVGLALALPFRGELEPKFIEPERKVTIEAQKPIRYGIAFAVMLAMGWGLRRARDDEAYAMGFVPFFLLTTASYYYYVARITLIVLHSSDLKKPRNQLGLALLVAIELFSNWAETTHAGHRVFLIGWLAWLLTLYALLMTGFFLWESRSIADDPDAGDALKRA